MPRRNRVIVLLVLPLVVIFWLVGWGLYRMGSRKEKAYPKAVSVPDGLTFTVLVPEKKIAT
jgi:hypothetical protein